jgi:hypothetical protein
MGRVGIEGSHRAWQQDRLIAGSGCGVSTPRNQSCRTRSNDAKKSAPAQSHAMEIRNAVYPKWEQ